MKIDTLIDLDLQSEPEIVDDVVLNTSQKDTDALKYIGGAMCKKFNLETKDNTNPNSWISMRGEGKFLEPSDEVFEVIQQFDKIFDTFHGKGLRECIGPLDKTKKLLLKELPSFNPKAIMYFCRVNFFARIRTMNRELKLKKMSQTNSKSVRYYKQSAQFVN